MTVFTVEGIARSDEPSEDYNSTPQFLSQLHEKAEDLSAHYFGFWVHNFIVLVLGTFPADVFNEKAPKSAGSAPNCRYSD